MKILFLNTLNGYWKERIKELENEFTGVTFIKNNRPEDRAACLNDADAVVSGRLTEEDLENAPKLKALFVPFTGLDNFAIDRLHERNVMIFNTHANYKTVSEHAVALALSLLGRIPEFHNKLKEGFWHLTIEEEDMWTSIHGRTCAIIGLGHIGSHIAKLLKAFECRVIGVRREIPDVQPDNVDKVTTELKEAISESQIIFVCLPLTDKTKGLINADILNSMEGKFLINVGRGATIDEEALYNALKDGILAGAALDVWYVYPGKQRKEPVHPSNYPIHELPNVVLSPHKSSHTTEAIIAMIDDTVENIRRYLRRL